MKAFLLFTFLATVFSARAELTSLQKADLDAPAFTQWVEGKETPAGDKHGPAGVIWTKESRVEWQGVSYGADKVAGVRHLRIGFTRAVPAGTLLVRGGGKPSVLKPGALYPGKVDDGSQWIEAARMGGTGETGREDFALWVLPPGTVTRALRFTHTTAPADADYAGWLGGVMVLGERYVNQAPLAMAAAPGNPVDAAKLNNESNDRTWGTWANGKEGRGSPVTAAKPEVITLVWPEEVELSRLILLNNGCGAATAQVFTGPASRHPREALESDWKTAGQGSGWESGYPTQLWPCALDFTAPVKTRAVRLLMTAPTIEGHPHLKGNTKDGKRVWMGDILALTSLGSRAIPVPRAAAALEHPPVPVKFTLAEAGFVTLVIDDAEGKRVRNLISEEPFPAGENTVWWDGTDDLARDPDAPRHGLYSIPPQYVAPGKYAVRGLFRKQIDLGYEFSVYNAGRPGWETADKTGGWMTNHTPPTSMVFVPGARTAGGEPLMYMGAFVSEGGHGLQWVDLDGTKRGGQGWVGGVWTGAPTLASDMGPKADAAVACYAGSIWEGELRLTAKMKDGSDKPVLKEKLGEDKTKPGDKDHPVALEGYDGGDRIFVLGGIAARDGVIVCTLPRQNELIFVNAREGKVESRRKFPEGTGFRGAVYDAEGKLWLLTGNRLASLGEGTDLKVTAGLELDDPRQLATGADGSFYISQRGKSHNVAVLSRELKITRTIGKPGVPQAGVYDPDRMQNPNGLAADDRGRLWVAENDYQPKRVSLWDASSGKLLRAWYGPGEYGGGGQVDPQDKPKFYYRGMEFKLDWSAGTDVLTSVYFRPGPGDLAMPSSFGSDGYPQTALYFQGRRYFTNCYNSNPTNGAGIAVLWVDRGGVAKPAAAFGRAKDWEVLKKPEFASLWPEKDKEATFLWCDENGDALMQPAEVHMEKGSGGGVTVMPDLAFVSARFGPEKEQAVTRWSPARFTVEGVPVYDLKAREKLLPGAQGPTSSGGDQALTEGAAGWTITSVAPAPFPASALGGAYKGVPRWQYPSLWPGLHASHEAPVPTFRGQVIGTTRLLGGFVTPRGGDAGPLFCINANMGNMYLFTADGLFVAELFKDVRVGTPWSMPQATRGMNLNGLSLHDENFFPAISQTADGEVYLVDGARTSLVKVGGLESIRRLPEKTLTLSREDLDRSREWVTRREAQRQKAAGQETLVVTRRKTAPSVDGKLDEWSAAQWAVIDQRGTAANFDSNSRPYNVSAALAVSGGKLYAVWRTGDKDLLRNSGETALAPFKNGGCLDLMLGPDGTRTQPGFGDLRLLVTVIKEKPLALLYRPVIPGAKEKTKFSSPWRTILFDGVADVSADLQFAADGTGNFELSIPLEKLGSLNAAGKLRGDVGILRGNGFQTLQRVYWSNKATAIVSDVPSEAELTPALWGKLEIKDGE